MANYYDLSYYAAQPVVDNIPASFRTYDRRMQLLTKISEGRSPLMRLLWGFAKNSGAYVAGDTETRWGIEHDRKARMFFASDSTSSSGTLHDTFHVLNAEGRRLQPGDILNVMGMWVSTARALANASGEDLNIKTSSFPLPEQVKVLTNAGDGSGNLAGAASATATKITVQRNFGGPAPTGHADMNTDIAGGTWTSPVTEPFLWKAGTSWAEGRDDQLTYSDVDTYDYNYCQIVGRKWSATETEQNVNRFFTSEKTFQRNGRRALDEFFAELDVMALFGTRKTETTNGRRKWYAGGLAEFIPSGNHVFYGDSLFQTKNFNEELKDKFYFGSQQKVALAGADYYTSFSNMIDNKIILPANVNSWGVELVRFRATNGGTILLTPSDTLSLHGMSDYMYLFDPSHFRYGHLQNMDIKTLTVNQTNPHEMEAEIYGQITFQRTNPDAHWVFLKATS